MGQNEWHQSTIQTEESMAEDKTSQDENASTARWWEKTVEYAFIRRFMTADEDAYPMAGKPEKAFGDLLLGVNDDFSLIEFKARDTDIKYEKMKFNEYVTLANLERERQGLGSQVKQHKPSDLATLKKPSEGTDAEDFDGDFYELLAQYCKPLIDHEGSAAHWLVYGNGVEDTFELVQRPYLKAGPEVNLTDAGDASSLTKVKKAVMLKYLDELTRMRDQSSAGGIIVMVGVSGGGSQALTVEEFAREVRKLELKIKAVTKNRHGLRMK
jgi:hypothetical protein